MKQYMSNYMYHHHLRIQRNLSENTKLQNIYSKTVHDSPIYTKKNEPMNA